MSCGGAGGCVVASRFDRCQLTATPECQRPDGLIISAAYVLKRDSVCYERSETAAGFSAEDLKRAEAQWREQGSPKGLTSD